MKRIVVAGARGFFGSNVTALLRADGCSPIAASRRAGGDLSRRSTEGAKAELRLDVEDRASIRTALHAGDVVVDATAPFHTRTTALLEEAVAIGFDIVDLCDNLAYARRAAAFDEAATARGIRIVNGCSSVSVLSAFALHHSGIREPVAIHGFLAPATRHTASGGAAASFLSSVGAAIDVWRDGGWRRARGWAESRAFRAIQRRGRLIEMADAFTLPRAFPSLRDVDFWVDPNTRGSGAMLSLGMRAPAVMPFISMLARYASGFTKFLGSERGVLAYEVKGSAGERVTVVFSGRDSFLMAAIPAALAARRLAGGDVERFGVIRVDRQVGAAELFEALAKNGIGVDLRET